MKVCLFYNEDAGDGVSLNHIRETMARHGHELVQVIERESGVAKLAHTPAELVVAAGGDGTVSAAARVLAGRNIPLAILPVGTANNVAKSVGSTGTVDELIGRWTRARTRPLDLGVARGAWGERQFVESVGAGLIPAGIAKAQAQPAPDAEPTPEKLAHAAGKYRDVLMRLRPRPWTITLDGQSITGRFLLVEVLNIPAVGANLVLSPDASPSDGFFTIVVAVEEHRQQLLDYVDQLIEGGDGQLSLSSHRATHLEIHGDDDIHVDDTLLSGTPHQPVSISIEPAALELLA